MRCFMVTSLLVVFLSVPVLGQPLPTPQVQVHPSAGQQKAVPIPQKLRYICKQLNLDEKQWQHAEGLFAILEDEQNMGPGQLRELLEQIRAITQEREAAREADDQERVEELNQQLKGLAPGARAKDNFIKGLLPALNEEQKVKLNVLLKRLENVTNLELKPIQVIRGPQTRAQCRSAAPVQRAGEAIPDADRTQHQGRRARPVGAA